MIRKLAALALVLAAPAAAQDGPSFDCSKAQGAVEEAICQDMDLAFFDRELSRHYKAALDTVRGLDAGAKAAEDELRATQRGWVKGRNECWKADDLRECVADAYTRRDGELVARWMLMPPASTVFWFCVGNRANEIVTMFFDSLRPAMRIERGDSIHTAVLTPTASGARYDGEFGRYFWTQGDTAIYREADPDGSEITCEKAR